MTFMNKVMNQSKNDIINFFLNYEFLFIPPIRSNVHFFFFDI